MKQLTVFYDERCELCRRCRDWLRRQPTFVDLQFIPLQSAMLEARYPALAAYRPEEEILVIADNGGLYRGGGAWLMCLWATQTYREWSLRLASPVLYPLIRKFVTLVSHNRLALSSLLSTKAPEDVAADIEAHAEVLCDDDTCAPVRSASAVPRAPAR
jgi:predicted DCC family thiol-disulfide oxidoreductase YuxK